MDVCSLECFQHELELIIYFDSLVIYFDINKLFKINEIIESLPVRYSTNKTAYHPSVEYAAFAQALHYAPRACVWVGASPNSPKWWTAKYLGIYRYVCGIYELSSSIPFLPIYSIHKITKSKRRLQKCFFQCLESISCGEN